MRIRVVGAAGLLFLGLLALMGPRLAKRDGVSSAPVVPWAGSVPVAASQNPVVLPPTRNEMWTRVPSEPAFARFVGWTRRHAAAGPDEQASLEAEGVALARVRLNALANLIQSHPERALQLSVPSGVRAALPAAVQALLEQPVNARGDLEVLAFRPLPGDEQKITPVVRYAVIEGERSQVFTYGKGLEFITKSGVPLNGLRVPASAASAPPSANGLPAAPFLMALHESPARPLDPAEIAALPRTVDLQPGCEPPPSAPATAVELAGQILAFCCQGHAGDWVGAAIAAEGMELPPPPEGFDTAASSYTEGRKKMLLLRPYWADQAVAMSTNTALSHFSSFSNYMFQMSYGKLVFAPLRQGSDISPEILMPGSVDNYSSGLGSTFTAIKNVARTNYGMDSADYDFVYYVTGSEPPASYAGLGFVGDVGFHLANGYFGSSTSAHEFGHNLGLNHASFWQTTPRTVIGAGSSVEYGDSTDPMGGGGDPNQFGSRYKNLLDWIPDSDIADLNGLGSGTYRLYCFDLNSGVGRRGLKFARTGSQNYWIQFRQRITSRAIQNGVQLLWTGNGNGSSVLLDPRLIGDADDNALVIGRTFSDAAVGLHVTPVGKGHTVPESMDVVVNLGSFAANQPPSCVVRASATSVNVGQSVSFSAGATDANGDALAYYWTFDDDDYSVDNRPTAAHSFAAAGEYTVQCTVSDMKGGVGRDSVVVRVGSPSTFRISGRVFNAQSRPLTGIRVSTDSTHFAYTDSDGAYTISDLAAGSYTLTALEPVTGTTTFLHPFFSNPVTVGPSAANRDFIVGTPLPPITIVAAGSTWKYLDNGSNQGTGWVATNFNDAGWASGAAQLGYGDMDETTVVSYGPNASAKFITTYFRRSFNVANPAIYTNLSVNVLRDDGVVVYLNGVEVFRSNMPGGTVTYTTLASASVDSQSYFSGPIAAGLLRAGTNVLAVELHQAAPDSSDASFDLTLTAESATNVVSAYMVYLTAPDNGATVTTPTNLTLTANALITVGSFTNVEFFDGALKLGEDATAPYSLALNNPATGLHTLTAVATTSGGIRRTSSPVALTVTLPAPPVSSLALVPPGASWRYLAGASAAPATWANLTFNDTAWPGGLAELGFGDGGEATTIPGGAANNRFPTIYFRRTFALGDPGAVTNLILQLKRDDGAVVYLNGVEVVRDNMPSGAIAYSTLAAAGAPDDGGSFLAFNPDPAALRVGTNLLAVEVHQNALDSSDLSFDLSLTALLSTNRPRGCWLVTPVAGANVSLPGALRLTAEVVAGGTLGVNLVEFYADGVKIGQTSAQPFTFDWSALPSGPRVLTAVATDTAGGAIPSAPVNVVIGTPPAVTALISFGDVWKYLDEGTDPGTTWRNRIYNDSLWMAGPARLGYGGDGELTTVSFGINPNTKFLTTHFRRAFTVANPSIFNGLFLQLMRDDGVVVYLNGTEVYRENLQPGLVSWNSTALAGIDGASETTPVEVKLPTTGLLAGTNVVAVEIHQVSPTSSDLGFDLSLTGLDDTNTVQGIYLSSPAAGAHFNSPANVPLAAFAAAPAAITLVEYFTGPTKVGQAVAAPYATTWVAAPIGSHVLTARATYGAGQTMTSGPISIVVGEPPPLITPVYQVLVPAGASWRYWDNVAAVAGNWTSPAASDSTWPSGIARFGWGLDGERTLLTEGRVTHYFRRWFTVTNPGVLTELVLDLQRDDGALVYVNGAEVFRSNMPAGPVTASTLASATVNPPDESAYFRTILPTPGLGLTTGSNLVAVELHQGSATSSDAGFDLQLAAVGTSEGRIYFSSPEPNTSFPVSSNITFEMAAWAGTGRSVSRIDLLADGVELGELTTAPYRFTWISPPFGPHTMLARLTDNTGDTLEAVLNLTVSRELVTTTLITSNSVWRFADADVPQPASWMLPAFNDSAWPSGAARLGFGGDGEVTLLRGQPTITYYFRRPFVPPPGVVYTNLTFRLARDDGAVVWLNGREAYRTTNMPSGTIAYATRALSSAGGADEQSLFPTIVTITNLPAGTNLVAVEVHQVDGTSSDAGFNLELVGSGYLQDLTPPVVAVVLADGLVELSWPSTYTGWRVYAAAAVNAPAGSWQALTNTPVLVSGRYVVAVVPSGTAQFFRLGRP